MADRAAARGPLLARSQSRSRSRIRYCRPVPVRRGLRRAAQPGTPRTGECICTRQQRHTRWGKACPSSPPPRETHAHALQTDGSGGNDDSREDMHGETQSSRRRTQRWGGLAACHCQRDSSGQKVAVARHRATEPHSTNAQLQHTRYCACAWSIIYRTVHAHTDAWLSPRTREKTLQPTASLLHASAISLQSRARVFTLHPSYWMESTGPASQVNNSQVTVGVSGSYPPPCAALDLPAAACLVPLAAATYA